jgi:ATP-dependent exoDNAse (exonuclease V) alpha subunit
MNNMQKVPRRIVIDECAGIGAKMAELVFDAARKYDKQLILVGDFAQTAPVKDDPAVETPLFMRANLINLKECHRQNGGVYLEALNEIRVGNVTDSARDVFRSRICDLPPEYDETTMRIYATRALVDSRNNLRLATIKSTSVMCSAEYHDARDSFLKERYPLKPEAALRALEQSPMAHGKSFKVGARVMMTLNVYNNPDSNDDRTVRWVNGDLGHITDILDAKGDSMAGRKAVLGQSLKPDRFIVKLDRTGKDTTVGIVDMPIYGVGKEPVAYISGFPMTLGWAVTVFKCQGLTLPRAYVDMHSMTHHPLESRHGQAYVALSRVRNLEDLYLSGWEDSAVHCSPAMKKFVQP